MDQPCGTGRIDRLAGKNTEQDDAEETADAMDTPDVQRVIPLESVLQGDRVVTDHPGGDADSEGQMIAED